MSVLTFGWTRADLGAAVTRHSADPLGLRAWANRVARDLTPGVTNVTNSVQGFALFCGGVRVARLAASTNEISADEAFRRFEALWVHAQTRHLEGRHASGAGNPSVGRWPGTRAAQRTATQENVDLSIGLLTQPLASGIFGAYRRSAIRFSLVRPQGGAIRPSTVGLTKAGTLLADLCLQHFWIAPKANTTPLVKILRGGHATREQLGQVAPDDSPRRAESLLLGKVIADSDRVARDGLHALRRCYDQDPDMFAVLRSPAALTPPQVTARTEAIAVLRLVEEIENPYRLWLIGDDLPPPSATLWDDELWTNIEAIGESDALALRESARSGTGWDGVHQWQKTLAAYRGGDSLERRFVPPT